MSNSTTPSFAHAETRHQIHQAFNVLVGWIVEHYLATITVYLAFSYLRTRYKSGLRHVPGPFIASVSSWWKLRAVLAKNMHRENVRVHEDYGPIVRIGPNHVSLADPESMKTIYGVQTVFRKV